MSERQRLYNLCKRGLRTSTNRPTLEKGLEEGFQGFVLMCAGYTYHLLHVQPRSLATSITASAAAAEFAYENMEAMEEEMVSHDLSLQLLRQ